MNDSEQKTEKKSALNRFRMEIVQSLELKTFKASTQFDGKRDEGKSFLRVLAPSSALRLQLHKSRF